MGRSPSRPEEQEGKEKPDSTRGLPAVLGPRVQPCSSSGQVFTPWATESRRHGMRYDARSGSDTFSLYDNVSDRTFILKKYGSAELCNIWPDDSGGQLGG